MALIQPDNTPELVEVHHLLVHLFSHHLASLISSDVASAFLPGIPPRSILHTSVHIGEYHAVCLSYLYICQSVFSFINVPKSQPSWFHLGTLCSRLMFRLEASVIRTRFDPHPWWWGLGLTTHIYHTGKASN